MFTSLRLGNSGRCKGIAMIDKLKKLCLVLVWLGLVSCGENPTSSLSEEFPILRSGPYGMDFSFIPNGFFKMGAPKEEGKVNVSYETPHWVRLTKDYWVQTKEVTRGQWYEVMKSYPDDSKCFPPSYGSIIRLSDHPIVCLEWDDVMKFIETLNTQAGNDGYTYRLPTEAEWEYATRAYTETPYFFAKELLPDYAWYYENSGNQTHPVGQLKPNLFGLYDVYGNALEWVSDWYGYYPKADHLSEAVEDPKGASGGDYRVQRGCGWSCTDRLLRSAYRMMGEPDYQDFSAGFRIVRVSQ